MTMQQISTILVLIVIISIVIAFITENRMLSTLNLCSNIRTSQQTIVVSKSSSTKENNNNDNNNVHFDEHLFSGSTTQKELFEEKVSLPIHVVDNDHEFFCLEWRQEDALNRTLQPIDEWWTHHPEYLVQSENDTHYCLRRNLTSIDTIWNIRLYHHQFHTTCNKIHLRYMWSSGWRADFSNVQCGLEKALDDYKAPLVMGFNPQATAEGRGWHYAINKHDLTNATCPEMDITCYFLPYHGCGKLSDIMTHNNNKEPQNKIQFIQSEELNGGCLYIRNERARVGYHYITSRRQLWLRRSIYDYIKNSHVQLPDNHQCTVMHVRRSDVVLHRQASRKYYAIADYIDKLPTSRKSPNSTILLLTDDANAIAEAHEFYPEINWQYLDRQRHSGSSGGWEHMTPSNDPALEVIILLATLELVKQCNAFVCGPGGYAEMITNAMTHEKGIQEEDFELYWLHEGQGRTSNINNTKGEEVLNQRLEEMRQQRKKEETQQHQ